MWNCPKCHEAIEDEYEICWNCGTAEDGREDPAFKAIDPDIAGEIPARPTPDSNPCGSRGDYSDELRDSVNRMRAAIHFLSFASVLAAAFAAFQFYCALRTYLSPPEMVGLAALIECISLEEILNLAIAAFVFGYIGIAYFLWRYSIALRNVLNQEKLTLGNILEAQRAFWKSVAITTGFTILIALLIIIYRVKFG